MEPEGVRKQNAACHRGEQLGRNPSIQLGSIGGKCHRTGHKGASPFLERSVMELESGQSLRNGNADSVSLASAGPPAKTSVNWHGSAWAWSIFSSSRGRPS